MKSRKQKTTNFKIYAIAKNFANLFQNKNVELKSTMQIKTQKDKFHLCQIITGHPVIWIKPRKMF